MDQDAFNRLLDGESLSAPNGKNNFWKANEGETVIANSDTKGGKVEIVTKQNVEHDSKAQSKQNSGENWSNYHNPASHYVDPASSKDASEMSDIHSDIWRALNAGELSGVNIATAQDNHGNLLKKSTLVPELHESGTRIVNIPAVVVDNPSNTNGINDNSRVQTSDSQVKVANIGTTNIKQNGDTESATRKFMGHQPLKLGQTDNANETQLSKIQKSDQRMDGLNERKVDNSQQNPRNNSQQNPGNNYLWNNSAWNSSAWNNYLWNNSAWNNYSWNNSAWNNYSWNNSAWNNYLWNNLSYPWNNSQHNPGYYPAPHSVNWSTPHSVWSPPVWSSPPIYGPDGVQEQRTWSPLPPWGTPCSENWSTPYSQNWSPHPSYPGDFSYKELFTFTKNPASTSNYQQNPGPWDNLVFANFKGYERSSVGGSNGSPAHKFVNWRYLNDGTTGPKTHLFTSVNDGTTGPKTHVTTSPNYVNDVTTGNTHLTTSPKYLK